MAGQSSHAIMTRVPWQSSARARLRIQMLRDRDPLTNPESLIRRVYSYAAYRLGDGAIAEDATSETLVRAVRYRGSYDANAGSQQAWVLGIARRVIAEHLATSAREMPAADVPSASQEDVDMTLERLELREALATLSQHERDLLALRYGADLAVKDVASIFGERTNAVEVALHRIVAKLRTQLEGRPANSGGK